MKFFFCSASWCLNVSRWGLSCKRPGCTIWKCSYPSRWSNVTAVRNRRKHFTKRWPWSLPMKVLEIKTYIWTFLCIFNEVHLINMVYWHICSLVHSLINLIPVLLYTTYPEPDDRQTKWVSATIRWAETNSWQSQINRYCSVTTSVV